MKADRGRRGTQRKDTEAGSSLRCGMTRSKLERKWCADSIGEQRQALDIPGEVVDGAGGGEDDGASGGEGQADQTLAGDFKIG